MKVLLALLALVCLAAQPAWGWSCHPQYYQCVNHCVQGETTCQYRCETDACYDRCGEIWAGCYDGCWETFCTGILVKPAGLSADAASEFPTAGVAPDGCSTVEGGAEEVPAP